MNFNKYGRTAQLFDYQTMSYGLVGSFLNSDGTITTNAASSSWAITKYIPVAGREFTLQRQALGGATSICLYDSNQTYITGLAYNGNGTVTVSANTDVSYIRFTYYRTENTGNIMLNEGSTAKPFEPYGNTWHDAPHYIMGTSTDTFTTLPADIYADGNTATVGLKGNTIQSGTPTPDNPIMPQGTGERTGNLFDKNDVLQGYRIGGDGLPFNDDGCALGDYIEVTPNTIVNQHQAFAFSNCMAEYDENKTFIIRYTSGNGKITTSASTKYIRVAVSKIRLDEAMVTMGATAPTSYEPYGYKIPISSANTTTPVYLGEVETTRRIKKLVLTGEETGWEMRSGEPSNEFFCSKANLGISALGGYGMCNVYQYTIGSSFGELNDKEFIITTTNVGFRDLWVSTPGAWIYFLQQQYAAGTPVTVWYVIEELETGIVNEPLRKIGDYADEVSGISIPTIAGANTLSIGTTLQPSEVTATYKGWHPIADVHKRESGAWT